MKKEEKNQLINELTEQLTNNPNFYLADTSGLTVEKVNVLRRKCFDSKIKMVVVKNTLLEKALEKTNRDYQGISSTLKGATSVMFCESGSAPEKLINEFRRTSDRPLLKAAFVEDCLYVGDNQIEALANIKSKNELIGDIIGLLQSPAKNVISALKSSGGKLAGIIKTLSEKPE
jgi:large subunit ribosomal protein L10